MLAPRLMLSPNMLRHCLVSVPSRAGHTGDLKGKPSGGSKPKRAERGLYGGKVIQSGNNVSFSINRNKRTWKPNVHSQSLFSELLGCKLTFRTTTHALRTIDKYGGIDNYLLKTPDGKLDSDVAVSTKRLLEATIVQQQARAAEKAAGSPLVTPGWTEEEEPRLAQLCEKGNYGKKDWGHRVRTAHSPRPHRPLTADHRPAMARSRQEHVVKELSKRGVKRKMEEEYVVPEEEQEQEEEEEWSRGMCTWSGGKWRWQKETERMPLSGLAGSSSVCSILKPAARAHSGW
jgi:large subunit ribosomal protein L28